jgi:hypothetical protein
MASHPASREIDPVALAEALERLEARVIVLEQALAMSAAAVGRTAGWPVAPAAAEAPDADVIQDLPPASTEWSGIALVTLTGRALVVLGGAYLLRALTEASILPPAAGVACGIAYALVWLALAARATPGASHAAATFHAGTTALIAFPLVWETTARFGLVSPTGGALLLGILTALMLAAAVRTGLEVVAWFGALAGTATALALAVTTSSFGPYTVMIALTGVATLWQGYVYDWVGLRWPIAGAANLMVLAVTLRALAPETGAAMAPAIALQMFVLVIYIGSFVARTLVLGREVVPFEMAQSAAVMALGFGGALVVIDQRGASPLPLGAAALAVGAAAYAFSFLCVEPRQQWRNLAFFTSLAMACALAGVIVLLPAALAPIVLGGLALACTEWARRSLRVTLAVHATIYVAFMAWMSGLLGASAAAFGASASTAWPALAPGMVLALATVALTGAWPHATVARLDTIDVRLLRLARLLLLAWAAAGLAIGLAVPLLTAPPGAGADPGVVATIRTIVLVTAALIVLASAQGRQLPERAWLAWAMLGGVGLKLVAEDLPKGTPSTLFLALAVYGAALILAPRMGRAAEVAPGTPAASRFE